MTIVAVGHLEGYECSVSSDSSNEALLTPSLSDSLGVVEAAFDTSDPVSRRAFAKAMQRAARIPVVRAGMGSLRHRARDRGCRVRLARLVGVKLPGVAHGSKDARFRSAWEDNVLPCAVQSYLLTSGSFVSSCTPRNSKLSGPEGGIRRAALSGAGPHNFLPPTRLRWCAFETAGGSLVGGLRNFLHDLVRNQVGRARSTAAPEVGENLATTPGKVVIATSSSCSVRTADQRWARYRAVCHLDQPLLLADLAPRKSLVEWAVQHRAPCSRSTQSRRVDAAPHFRRLPAVGAVVGDRRVR
jgi:hypothetical protein